MDVLLSLPIASYLLGPASSSWSTSLNLLFFYMTWTTLVLSHSPLKIRLIGSLGIRLVLWLIPSLITLLFDVALPSLSESIKFAGRSALPPRDFRRLLNQLGLAILNLLLVTGVEGASSLIFAYVFQTADFRTSTTLPLPWQMAKHILVLMTALPYSLQLFTDHPLPLLLHRFVPVYLPALILRPHLLTYFLFLGLCTSEETLAMSGYSIVPGIIMGGIARRCSIHYAGKGASNFGAWGVLDWTNGTSRGGDVLEDVKAEAEKHHLKDRSAEKVDDGVGIVQSGIDALRNGNGTRKSPRLRSSKRS